MQLVHNSSVVRQEQTSKSSKCLFQVEKLCKILNVPIETISSAESYVECFRGIQERLSQMKAQPNCPIITAVQCNPKQLDILNKISESFYEVCCHLLFYFDILLFL